MSENNIKVYEDALRAIGFDENLQDKDGQHNDSNAEEKWKRNRKIIWFNPTIQKQPPEVLYAGLMPATLLKKRLWNSCFLVDFVEFLRTPFLQNTFDGCF